MLTPQNPAPGDPTRQTESPPASDGNDLGIIVDRLTQLWDDFLRSTPRIVASILVLVLTWAVAKGVHRLLGRLMKRSHLRTSLRDLIQQLAFAAAWIVGLLIAAIVLFPSLTPGSAIAALGIGSVAIGFAFKDIFENFFAGVLILWRFPFEIGDFIRCGDIVGKVELTNIRMTLVRQTDGRLMVVPNARLFKEPVEVLTSQELARLECIVGVAYKEDVDEARSVIQGAMDGLATIATSKPRDVQVCEFNSSSVDFRVLWWTGSEPRARRESLDEVHTAIKHALDEAGIEIPFPYRTLTFDAGASVAIEARHRSPPPSPGPEAPPRRGAPLRTGT